MRYRVASLLAALLAGPPTAVAAQESPPEVAAAFFKAVEEERWRDAARRLDLAAFDRFRREHVAAARLNPPARHRMTIEELLRHDPEMPRAVAEYQLKKMNEQMSDVDYHLLTFNFANVPSLDSLAALSREEAAARWLQAQDFRWQMTRAYERERKRCDVPPETVKTPVIPHRILGSIVHDSGTAYVVHRMEQRARGDIAAAVHSEPPQVMTLRRRNERWEILPREGMLRGAYGVVGVSFGNCLPARPPR